MTIREMNIKDYEEVIKLLKNSIGVTTREADSRANIEVYLKRNPHLNFVVTKNFQIIGCVMCGHDSRRGYLQHLVVKSEFQNQGIGKKLFVSCLNSLKKIGIYKTHIFVFKTNELANHFWQKQGWNLRDDINMYSFNASLNDNI